MPLPLQTKYPRLMDLSNLLATQGPRVANLGIRWLVNHWGQRPPSGPSPREVTIRILEEKLAQIDQEKAAVKARPEAIEATARVVECPVCELVDAAAAMRGDWEYIAIKCSEDTFPKGIGGLIPVARQKALTVARIAKSIEDSNARVMASQASRLAEELGQEQDEIVTCEEARERAKTAGWVWYLTSEAALAAYTGECPTCRRGKEQQHGSGDSHPDRPREAQRQADE